MAYTKRFNQVKFILDNPGKASKLLSEGRLTADQAKALATVWPSIFDDLKKNLILKNKKKKTMIKNKEIWLKRDLEMILLKK